MGFQMDRQIIFYTDSTKILKKSLLEFESYVESGINLTIIVRTSQIDLANQFDNRFPGCITIANLDPAKSIKDQVNYLRSRFSVPYFKAIINKPLTCSLINSFLRTAKPKRISRSKPLVSIAIYNYNYGAYITECLESIIKQTYQKFEICISDNASSDESWKIISDYVKKYPNKIKAIKNNINMGAGFNRENAEHLASGEYLLVLTSDDYIAPDFLEKTVNALESNTDCVFAMVHRDIVTDDGKIIKEKPFYDRSCKIDGHAQAAVFMMAGVNPSISQIIYRRSLIGYGSLVGGHVLNVRWFGERIKDFEMCCRAPIIYIHEPLLKNRVHYNSDGSSIDRNLIQAVGQFLLVHQFKDIADVYSNKLAAEKLPDAIWKVATLCLRYSIDFMSRGQEDISKRYLSLSMALQIRDHESENYRLLYDYHFNGNKKVLSKILDLGKTTARQISYEPPAGSTSIELKVK